MCPGSRQFAPAPLFTQLVLCTLLDRELPVAAGLRPVCTKTSPNSLGQWFLLLSLPPSILFILQPHLIGAVRTPAGEPVDSAFGFSGSEQGPQDAREQPADSLRTMSLKGQAGTSQTSPFCPGPSMAKTCQSQIAGSQLSFKALHTREWPPVEPQSHLSCSFPVPMDLERSLPDRQMIVNHKSFSEKAAFQECPSPVLALKWVLFCFVFGTSHRTQELELARRVVEPLSQIPGLLSSPAPTSRPAQGLWQ